MTENTPTLLARAFHLLDSYHARMNDMFPYPDPWFGIVQWPVVIGYVISVFVLPKVLKNSKTLRNGLEIGKLMALWNALLSSFSFIAMIGVLRDYGGYILEVGLAGALCDTKNIIGRESRPTFFWAYWFAISKYAELVDTLLLILKKPSRPVPFLHWYHHATVLLFTWYMCYFHLTAGSMFILVNSFIHAIMYGYYFLKELGVTPPGAVLITILQIAQMAFGIVVNSIWAFQYFKGSECSCHNPRAFIFSCTVVYGSYLFLFGKYFVNRYMTGDRARKNIPLKRT